MIIENWCSMWHYGITQSGHCNSINNDNDDNLMLGSLWIKIFGGFSYVKIYDKWEEKCDNKEGDLNWAHPFPRVLEYYKGSDIKEGVALWILRCTLLEVTPPL